MFREFFMLSILGVFPLFSDHSSKTIDFGSFASVEHTTIGTDAWRYGYFAFNSAPEITPVFADLKHKYNISTAIETGTYYGSTTALFCSLFDEVHTIDSYEPYWHYSSARLAAEFQNVCCHLGSSEKVFSYLLPTFKDKFLLFYLDAHWESFWPLLDELEEISKTHKDNCIVVIDDFKVPNRPDIPYDSYGRHECSYEYIKEKLDKIYTNYTYYYLIPKSPNSRAKFIAIPAD